MVVFALVSNVGETNIAANRLVWFVLVAVLATAGAREPSPYGPRSHRARP